MIYILIFLTAAMLALLLTPLAGRIGHQWGLVDRPGGRRKHRGVIPRTGGLALYGAFTLTILLALWLPHWLPEPLLAWVPPRNDPNELRRLTGLLVGSTFCVVMGLLDDRYELPSGPQYAVQFIASLIAISSLIILKHINNPFGAGYIGGIEGLPWWGVWLFTTFWFMGMMNTINWLDGLSGLVAGITAILCLVLAIHMLYRAEEPQLSVAILPVALLGVTVGFLPFNFSPARIFMGSSGSYFLGFAVAALGIIGGARVATVMLVLGLPILDVAWLIIYRWRSGRSPGQGGRDHLHFRLYDLGLNERTVVLGYWGFCAMFGAMTLLLDARIYKLVALLVLGMLSLAVLVWASREKSERRPYDPHFSN